MHNATIESSMKATLAFGRDGKLLTNLNNKSVEKEIKYVNSSRYDPASCPCNDGIECLSRTHHLVCLSGGSENCVDLDVAVIDPNDFVDTQ